MVNAQNSRNAPEHKVGAALENSCIFALAYSISEQWQRIFFDTHAGG